MRSRIGLVVVLAAALVIAAMAAATPAGAARAVLVSGAQVASPGEPEGTFDNSGSLIGRWTTTSFEVRSESVSGNVYTLVGTGTEHFVGCLDLDRSGACGQGDAQGTLDFSFVFRGTYDATTFAQLSGACIHPVTAGTGDFARTRGVIAYRDDVNTGISYYTGVLAV
jgi:hypothetical protein